MSQPGTVPGAVLELHAARAHLGMSQGEGTETQFFDTSGNGNAATLTNFNFDATDGWRGVGTLADPHRLVTDGVDDTVGATIPMKPITGYSMELWYTPRAIHPDYRHIADWCLGGTDGMYLYSGTGGLMHPGFFSVGGGWAWEKALTGVLQAGALIHIVCTITTTTASVYKNGSYLDGGAVSGTVAMPDNRPFSLSSATPNTGPFGDYLVARAYPFALTPTQVAQNYAAGYLWYSMAQSPRRDVDDSLWQILAGDDATGWRDVTDECGGLVYTTVMPGGPGSASFSLPADVWGLGYNEVRADSKLKISYAGRSVWSGFILPRGVNYQGE